MKRIAATAALAGGLFAGLLGTAAAAHADYSGHDYYGHDYYGHDYYNHDYYGGRGPGLFIGTNGVTVDLPGGWEISSGYDD